MSTGLSTGTEYLSVYLFSRFFFLFSFCPARSQLASHLNLPNDDLELGHTDDLFYTRRLDSFRQYYAAFDFNFDSKGHPPRSLLLHDRSGQFSTYRYIATRRSA
jgi:hypothetical protein